MPALDGLRGLAILLVMAHHFSVVRSDVPFDAAVLALVHTGWMGVDLFFVLSGFLITGILIDARDSERYFASFYMRRILRIVPLYYLIVFLSYHVLPRSPEWHLRLVGYGEIPTEWPFWLFVSNFVMAEREQFQHGVLFLSWSLSVEEQFYLLWAVVVWLWPTRWLGRLCVLIVLVAPVLRALAAARGLSPIEIYVLTPFRADALAVGAWLAWRLRQPMPEAAARLAPRVVAAALAGLVALAWWDGHLEWDTWGKQSLGYSLLALAGGGALLAAITRPATSWWVRVFSLGWLRSIGKYSYCLYLTHLPVMWTVKDFVFDPTRAEEVLGSALPAQALLWGLAFVPAYALAWTSWRVLEAPFLSLKRYFPY